MTPKAVLIAGQMVVDNFSKNNANVVSLAGSTPPPAKRSTVTSTSKAPIHDALHALYKLDPTKPESLPDIGIVQAMFAAAIAEQLALDINDKQKVPFLWKCVRHQLYVLTYKTLTHTPTIHCSMGFTRVLHRSRLLIC